MIEFRKILRFYRMLRQDFASYTVWAMKRGVSQQFMDARCFDGMTWTSADHGVAFTRLYS